MSECQSKEGYCIVCKNRVCNRYMLTINDTKNGICIADHLCRDCYNRFLCSHANEGVFGISRFIGWAKRKDRIRE